MHIAIDRTGTLEGLAAALRQIETRPEVNALIVLCADENDHVPATTDPVLRGVAKPLYGGTFPGLVVGSERLARGSIVIGTSRPVRATVVERLSDADTDLDTLVDAAVHEAASDSLLLVLVDGLARRIAALVRALFDAHGLTINYLGGGAGSLSLVQKPCLFTNAGMLEDAALLLQLVWPSGVGVAHGWEVISEPLKITRVAHTTIEQINYEPAFDVYRRVVEPRIGASITADGFFDVAKGFPFGIRKLDAEVVVRDPIVVTPEGGLVCVGEVPVGSFVHILEGQAAQLVAASRTANARAADALAPSRTPQLRFVVDCISRTLFLGEGFSAELEALDDGRIPLIGVLTLGEIANSGRDFLELYNKTVVVGLLAAS